MVTCKLVSGYDIHINGQVQGVGFRPHVFNLACELGLNGSVCNNGDGVHIQLIANQAQLTQFIDTLYSTLPKLAQIDSLSSEETNIIERADFVIEHSEQSQVNTQIAPDAATCSDCLKDLFSPDNRRYLYPFTNCTNCGPRYSIIQKLPYDRPYTTMAEFTLCQQCLKEYQNPQDRRFHAQPNACPECGPKLELLDNNGKAVSRTDSIAQTVSLLQQGKIVAIKGLGGYHLVCEANNIEAVNRLRDKKARKTKPLSLMSANISSLAQFVEINKTAQQYLTSTGAPIVLCKKRQQTSYQHIAPDINWLGVMLPYTPLHYLLFHYAAGSPNGTNWLNHSVPLTLVMTSANAKGQPLIFDEKELPSLLNLADFVLSHNRAIDKRIDDSIVNCVTDEAIIIRRGRGMAPKSVNLAKTMPASIALGGFYKNSICLTRDNKAYLSQYIGDLNNPDNCRYLAQTVEHMMSVFDIQPEQVFCDLHPNFYSSQFAEQFAKQYQLPLKKVQHHYAHAAAVACEHQVEQPYLAVCLDGVGLGEDGDSWGGELLRVENNQATRIGHFKPLTLPGGDAAAKEGWRLAVAFLLEQQLSDKAEQLFSDLNGYSIVKQMVSRQVNCPKTSSCGRLFDLAAALLGISLENSFEAESAMKLESALSTASEAELAEIANITAPLFTISPQQEIDFSGLLSKLLSLSTSEGAALFHQQLVQAITEWLKHNLQCDSETPVNNIVLAGGCFLNAHLLQMLKQHIKQQITSTEINIYSAKQIPPSDSAIALGQVWAQGIETSNKSVGNPLCV